MGWVRIFHTKTYTYIKVSLVPQVSAGPRRRRCGGSPVPRGWGERGEMGGVQEQSPSVSIWIAHEFRIWEIRRSWSGVASESCPRSSIKIWLVVRLGIIYGSVTTIYNYLETVPHSRGPTSHSHRPRPVGVPIFLTYTYTYIKVSCPVYGSVCS